MGSPSDSRSTGIDTPALGSGFTQVMPDARSPANGRDAAGTEGVELSVVIPCLDEAETLPSCITTARRAMEKAGITGEIIVGDNGSSDGSPELARRCGARVVHVEARGYGNALRGAIGAACGEYVIMGDADGSYDFSAIPRFVEKLREGYDLVMGCRLEAGGGTVLPGAMPLLHRVFGNPGLSLLCKLWFDVPINDMYCGLRGFRRDFQANLHQRCTGMEYAHEMVLSSMFAGGAIAEIPITLHPDGRTAHGPHLRTFRDGWRTLRFLLMYSPRWLFFVPGLLLLLVGAIGYAVAYPGLTIGGVHFEMNSLLVSSLAILLGFQVILFAVFTKMFGIAEGFLPPSEAWDRAFKVVTLETGIVAGGLTAVTGFTLIAVAAYQWGQSGFGDLDYGVAMRMVIPGFTLAALGVQTVFASFFASILGLKRT